MTALGLMQASETSAAAGDSDHGGTLMYLAPELLAGHAQTVQGDVYSLGVLLFQLVAGDLRRRLATGWQREVSDPLLIEDIEAATQAAPSRRTHSVGNLVDTLERLDERRQERALQAANATLAQAAAMAAERRRARRPWLLLGVAVLVLSAIVSASMAVRAELARKAALQARAQAVAVGEFLQQDVMEAPDVLTSGKVKPLPWMTLMRQASRDAEERFRGQPMAEATVRRRIAETYLRRAAVAEAIRELNKARKLLEAAGADNTTEGLLVRFVQARAVLQAEEGPRAQALLDEAMAVISAAERDAATDLGAAATRSRLDFMLDAGRAREAIPLALRLVAQVDAIRSSASPHRLDARRLLAEACMLADMLPEAAQVFEQLAKAPFYAPGMANDLAARRVFLDADKLAQNGQHTESLALLRKAREMIGTPAVANRFQLAWFEQLEGGVALAQGRVADARKAFETSQALFVECLGNDHVYVVESRQGLAMAALAGGRAAEAAALFDEVDQWHLQHVSELGHTAARFGLVSALIDLGRASEAMAILDAIPMAQLARQDPAAGLDARVAAERARALLALGRVGEGRPMLRQAVLDMKQAKVPAWWAARYDKLL